MRNFKKIICTAAALSVLTLGAGVSASADTTLSVPIRIEGVSGNLFYETVSVTDSDGKITAADALIFADEQSDKLTIKGADSGYITEINGEKAGAFGGYDGWYYAVNMEVPTVGVNDFELKDGDELVVYYGGFPCQLPFVETDRLDNGVIAFKSNDVEYDENWNASNVVNPVSDAEVTIGDKTYTTDKNGEITLDKDTPSGELSAQIAKKDSSGAPCVLRFAPDFTITYTNAQTSSDTDSDKASDSDTDTDKTADTDSDTSSKASSSASTQTSTQTVKSAAPAVSTAAASVSETPAATGDGRTYAALAVFGAAAILVAILLLIGKVTKKKD